MPTRVTDLSSAAPESIRRKSLTAHNDASMRTMVDTGEFGTVVLDEPIAHRGQGQGPSPLQAVVGALCGREAVTFCRTAEELGLTYDSLDFEASYAIDVRGRMGDRSVRPHFQKVTVRAVVATDDSEDLLQAVVEETEARCPLFNLLRDADVDLHMEWVRDAG